MTIIEAAGVVRAARALGEGEGKATVLATGDRLPPIAAAVANACYAMAHDFDDIVWTGHTCHSAVFAALAVAEHEGSDGTTTSARVDFPAGTFALPTCEATLRKKWIQTVGDDASFEVGLTLGATSIAELMQSVKRSEGVPI